jgi:hypothetical protein
MVNLDKSGWTNEQKDNHRSRIQDIPVQKTGSRSADQPDLETAAAQIAIDFRHFAMTRLSQTTLLEPLEVSSQTFHHEIRKFPEMGISSYL